MKLSLFSIAMFAFTISTFAQTEKPTDSKITNVTVFLNRAQVSRQVQTTIDAGKTSLIVKGLASALDPESIQVSGKGNFVILGISHRQNYLTELVIPKSLKQLKDSVVILQQLESLEQSQTEILNKEEQMLLSNQKIGGTNQNLTVVELKGMADFYRSRLTEIVLAKIKQTQTIAKLNARGAKLQAQIDSQTELLGRNTSEIVVNLSAENPESVSLEVSYIVANAGWVPVYDLRAINTKSPIQLSYKANVFQSTGEEWKNVRLKLSTANPTLTGLKPELESWYLNFEQSFGYGKRKSVMDALAGKVAGIQVQSAARYRSDTIESKNESDAPSIGDYVTTIQTSLNTEFDIALPYTVGSATTATLVDIRKYDMKADYEYAVAPKLDADAFLLAKATGWEEYSLLPGEASIFFEGSFVGKTFINPNSTKDTLAVSLGRDKRISVKREKVKDLSSRKFIASNQREAYVWEITVRNNKAEAIKIVVEDQIPVSQNSQIEVTAGENTGAKYVMETGKLTWKLNLQPNESKKLIFKYEIKYPKNRTIEGV